MKSNRNLTLFLIHLYFIFTVLAIILFFVSKEGQFICNLLGASSGYVTFGIMISDLEIAPVIVLLLTVWVFTMPILFTTVYILAIKKHYFPICTFSTVDSLIVVIWVIYAYLSGNSYRGNYFLFDAFISTAFTVLLFLSSAKISSKKDRALSAVL